MVCPLQFTFRKVIRQKGSCFVIYLSNVLQAHSMRYHNYFRSVSTTCNCCFRIFVWISSCVLKMRNRVFDSGSGSCIFKFRCDEGTAVYITDYLLEKCTCSCKWTHWIFVFLLTDQYHFGTKRCVKNIICVMSHLQFWPQENIK